MFLNKTGAKTPKHRNRKQKASSEKTPAALNKKKPLDNCNIKTASIDSFFGLSHRNMSDNVSDVASVSSPITNKDSVEEYKSRLRNHSYQQSVEMNQQSSSLNSIAPIKEMHLESQEIESEQEEEATNVNVRPINRKQSEALDEMGSIEDLLPPRFLLKKDEFEKKTTPNKLDSVFDAVNNLYTMYAQVEAKMKPLNYAVFDNTGGILPQIQDLVAHAKEKDTKIELLTAEVVQLREELDITKGLLHKQSNQIATLKSRQTDLIARSMAENITIVGIGNDKPNVDTKTLVLGFLEDELGVVLEDEENIPIAHRIGTSTKGHHRPIVFKCPVSLKKRIFENTHKLAGKRFSVNQQLPDALAESRRENRQKIKQIQHLEEGKMDKDKSTFLIRNNRLYVNGQLQRKKIIPPPPIDLFPCATDRNRMAQIPMKYSQTKPAQTSSFSAAACTVDSMNDIHLAYKRLFREFPEADHIVAAANYQQEEMFQDDSEFGAGYRLLNIIRDFHLGNVAVFVIRHYGGEHVGPMRFAIMKDVAEEAIAKLG